MKLFVDTNVFVASLTDEPARGDVATELSNEEDVPRAKRGRVLDNNGCRLESDQTVTGLCRR
jgi:hypothetical protein